LHVKKWVVEKYAKFDKYAKPKIFLRTTSKKWQISKIWHKNMPVGNTGITVANAGHVPQLRAFITSHTICMFKMMCYTM